MKVKVDNTVSEEFSADSSNDEESYETQNVNSNSGWADSMQKILKSNKSKTRNSLVLSKAKKSQKIKRKAVEFEVVNEENVIIDTNELKDAGSDDVLLSKKKKVEEHHPDLRLKPNILEREREKKLSKIATRGVVQLFNAVRSQQKDIEEKISASGPMESKKEKVIKGIDKNKFLDMLMGQSKSESVNKSLKTKIEQDKDLKCETSSSWNVFRDDFMMGAKMKDWDKKIQDEDVEGSEVSEDSD